MAIDFSTRMASLSEYELNEYINSRNFYTKEAIEAAIIEMKNRGKELSEDEISDIMKQFKKNKIESVSNEKVELFESKSGWKNNVVTDENAPQFYSQKAIYLFSVIFSVVFGSIMMAINFRKTESKKGFYEVLIFGVLFIIFQVSILSMIPRNTFFTYGFSAIGAFILDHYFWRKYIGGETRYRTKSIWIPLAIGIGILGIFMYFVITLSDMGIPIE